MIREHLRHFLDAPLDTVVVVDKAHRGQLDRRIERFHPLVQFVFLQYRDSLGGCGFCRVLAALVSPMGRAPSAEKSMRWPGNNRWVFFLIFFLGSKVFGVPLSKKSTRPSV